MTEKLFCPTCQLSFNRIDFGDSVSLLLLTSHPEETLSFWQHNKKKTIQQKDHEIADIKRKIEKGNLLKATRVRLSKLRETQIREKNLLDKYLAFLGDTPHEFLLNEEGEGHGLELTRYLSYVFRDWSQKSNNEIQSHFSALQSVIKNSKQINQGKDFLVLGAGAGRLAYETARIAGPSSRFFLLDINPLLLKVAAQMIEKSRAPELIEIPLYPKDPTEIGQEIEWVKVEKLLNAEFFYIWGDVRSVPFADQSFDVVITPWFLDIDPRGPAALMNTVAKLLKPAGEWWNTGPLAFADKAIESQWGVDEMLECLGVDFDVQYHGWNDVPYLERQNSYHHRIESIWNFLALRKEAIRNLETRQFQGSWNLDSKISESPSMTQSKLKYEMILSILSQIDGVKTAKELSQVLVQKYGFTESDAEQSVLRFLKKMIR